VVANLARSSQPVELALSAFRSPSRRIAGEHGISCPSAELPYVLTLPRGAFYWFALTNDAATRSGTRSAPCRFDSPSWSSEYWNGGADAARFRRLRRTGSVWPSARV